MKAPKSKVPGLALAVLGGTLGLAAARPGAAERAVVAPWLAATASTAADATARPATGDAAMEGGQEGASARHEALPDRGIPDGAGGRKAPMSPEAPKPSWGCPAWLAVSIPE
jgi:hypothetical protein